MKNSNIIKTNEAHCQQILFKHLKYLLEDAKVDFGGQYLERFNSDENINEIIDELNKKFEIKLRE